MRRWRLWTDDDAGSAALEFILMGLVLLVPVVYLVVTLGLIQGQTMGVEAGARHIARAVSLAPDIETARARADEVLRDVVDEYGLDAKEVEVAFRCRPAGVACPSAGATLVVTVRTRVGLPLVPPVLGLDRLARVDVAASAAQRISRYWGAG
ncbi:MAG: TadE family protein [Microbacterium sp.]|nr:TadE family protein [Microbacterium sp.]